MIEKFWFAILCFLKHFPVCRLWNFCVDKWLKNHNKNMDKW